MNYFANKMKMMMVLASEKLSTASDYPITILNSAGKKLKQYKIYGNCKQNGTPAPSDPIEVKSVGDLITDQSSENYDKYQISVQVADGTYSRTTDIYLSKPLYKIGNVADYIDFKEKKVVRYFNTVDMGTLSWYITSSNIGIFGTVSLQSIVKKPINGTYGKLMCPILKLGGVYLVDNSIQLESNGALDIKSNEFKNKTVSQMVSLLSGVDLIYELNTPTEESIILPSISTYSDANTISSLSETAPSNMEIQYVTK